MPRKPDNKKKRASKFVDSDSDNSSVDSKGNVRNLIDYDYEESDEDDMFEMEEVGKRTKRQPRKAALDARKKMKSIMNKMDESVMRITCL
jgi:hypothetical protein